MPYAEIGIVAILAGVIFWAIAVQVRLGKVLKERDHALAENKELRTRLALATAPPITDRDEQRDGL